MNKARRKAYDKIADQIAVLISKVEDLKSELETIRDEEQEYYDAMPESFQNGDKGQAATDVIEKFETTLSALEEFTGLDLSLE